MLYCLLFTFCTTIAGNCSTWWPSTLMSKIWKYWKSSEYIDSMFLKSLMQPNRGFRKSYCNLVICLLSRHKHRCWQYSFDLLNNSVTFSFVSLAERIEPIFWFYIMMQSNILGTMNLLDCISKSLICVKTSSPFSANSIWKQSFSYKALAILSLRSFLSTHINILYFFSPSDAIICSCCITWLTFLGFSRYTTWLL